MCNECKQLKEENERLWKALHTSIKLLDDEIQSGIYEKYTNIKEAGK